MPVFLCNRKFLGIPYYTKRHLRANDVHLREAETCRKRPRSARECDCKEYNKYRKRGVTTNENKYGFI